MKLPRRKFLHLAASAAALPAVTRMAKAQTYPTRPVHMSFLAQVFGRRVDEPIHALLRPASEKRQGTKSRKVGQLRCSGRYGDSAAA